jgi:hypothetical protein
MSTSFTQTTIYFPPDFGPALNGTEVSTDLAGYGNSQCPVVTNTVATTVGQIISVPFQVAVPPPLLYIATLDITDSIIIQCPDGLNLQPNPITTRGIYGVYFQPSAGGKYTAYYKSGTAAAIGSNLLTFQAVLQNTVGQFLNLPALTFPQINLAEVEIKPTVKETVALNTTSAVPNTIEIDFVRIPVRRGINVLMCVPVQVGSNAVESWGADYLSASGVPTKSVILTAGQPYYAQWVASVDGYLSAKYSITLQSAGSTTLPATCSAYAAPDIFANLSQNTPSIFLETGREDIDKDNNSTINELKNWIEKKGMAGSEALSNFAMEKINSELDTLKQLVMKGFRMNADAHRALATAIERINMSVNADAASQFLEELE